MRLMIGALLLASVAAVPAVAQDRPQGDWHQSGGDHGGDRGGHDARGDGGNRGGPQGSAPQTRAPNPGAFNPGQVQRPQAPQGGFGGNRGGGGQPQGGAPDGSHRVYGRPDNGVRVWRDDRGTAQRPDWGNRPAGQPGGWDRNRDGRPDWQTGDRGRQGGWNSGWRSDRRYDWQGWRSTHRDYYRVGPYRTPWGYHGGYRRWGIGVRIDPIFFAQDYWIDNPDYYRLPPAYGGYRWVRYYNDALLVDIYSGTVIDEIPDFFW